MTAVEPDSLAEALLDWLRARRSAMRDELCALARLESPSLDPATIGPVFDALGNSLRALRLRVRVRKAPPSGGILVACRPERARGRGCQLLLGHADTVWPVGTLAEMPLREDPEGRLHGPGVYDMKGGLVQMLFALRALEALGLEPTLAPVVFVNSDEEIGSGASRRALERISGCVDRVLVLEPSLGEAGHLKTRRSGVGRYRVIAHGRAAHTGLDPTAGVSATLELAHQIQTLAGLNDRGRGVIVNVGEIEGGLRPNVVAPRASAHVDVRMRMSADGERLDGRIHALEPVLPGARIEVQGFVRRPPLEKTPGNARLYARALDAAGRLGIELGEAAAGGASDGNLTSARTPTLDGLGGVGAGAHAPDERIELDRMPERAALLALLLLEPRFADRDGCP